MPFPWLPATVVCLAQRRSPHVRHTCPPHHSVQHMLSCGQVHRPSHDCHTDRMHAPETERAPQLTTSPRPGPNDYRIDRQRPPAQARDRCVHPASIGSHLCPVRCLLHRFPLPLPHIPTQGFPLGCPSQCQRACRHCLASPSPFAPLAVPPTYCRKECRKTANQKLSPHV